MWKHTEERSKRCWYWSRWCARRTVLHSTALLNGSRGLCFSYLRACWMCLIYNTASPECSSMYVLKTYVWNTYKPLATCLIFHPGRSSGMFDLQPDPSWMCFYMDPTAPHPFPGVERTNKTHAHSENTDLQDGSFRLLKKVCSLSVLSTTFGEMDVFTIVLACVRIHFPRSDVVSKSVLMALFLCNCVERVLLVLKCINIYCFKCQSLPLIFRWWGVKCLGNVCLLA